MYDQAIRLMHVHQVNKPEFRHLRKTLVEDVLFFHKKYLGAVTFDDKRL